MVTLSALSPKAPSLVPPGASLFHSAPHLPEFYCLWFSPSVVNLVTLDSAIRLKHHRARAESPLGLGLFFPLSCSEGCGLPEHDGNCLWWITRHWDLCGYCLRSLPKAAFPRLSSGISSHSAPIFARTPSK